MDYKNKYLKYKTKYLELKNTDIMIGGDKNNYDISDKIVNFIKNSKKQEIIKKLLDVIQNTSFCPIVLGRGFGGKAYLPEIDKTFPYKVGNKIIQLPVVVKVENSNSNDIKYYFGLDMLDSKLYISGYGGLTTEALILMLIKNLRSKTVHLPLLLAYGTCSQTKIIDRIYTLRYGLDKPVEINLVGKIYDEDTLWHKSHSQNNEIFTNTIATIGDLFTYIHYKKNKDDNVILPNNIKCNIVELYDYLCISYLATHHLLTENNIFPSDMHTGNIFIHWLNDNSYFNDKNIKNLKEITYKIDNKYYKIKTFGFVLILGDTGTFIIKIKKDIILIGQAPDIKNDYSKYDRRMKATHNNIDFIKFSSNLLTPRQFEKTIAFKIMNTEPYCNYPYHNWKLLGTDISYLDNMKSTEELLEFYHKKYGINKYEKKDDNILIKIN
jgi:hypothetical protein